MSDEGADGGRKKMQLSWFHEICENCAPFFCSKICSNILVISAIPRVYHARNSRDLFCSAPRLGGIQFPDFLETTKLMDSSYQTCTSRDINITIHSQLIFILTQDLRWVSEEMFWCWKNLNIEQKFYWTVGKLSVLDEQLVESREPRINGNMFALIQRTKTSSLFSKLIHSSMNVWWDF